MTAKRRRALTVGAAAVALAMLGLIGFAITSPWRSGDTATTTGPARPAVSLAVLPFRNATGDPALDSLGTSLSEVLATDLGESSHVRTVPSERLHQVLGDLRIDSSANLSPSELSRIANFASAQSILWGQYVKFGDEIRIDATLQDLDQRVTTPLKATAKHQSDLLEAVALLAGSVQQTLAAGSADVLSQLKATAWRPSTHSFDALRLYNEGLQLSRNGNHQTALKRFEEAVQEDSGFALAFSALAQTYANLGYDAQASQFSRQALQMSESLPVQERYLIEATHYRIGNDREKGIETYEKLLKISPGNARIHFELGSLYEQTGALDKAQEQFTKAVDLDPNYVDGLTAVGRVNIRRGDPQASLSPLNKALTLAVQLDNDEARATVLQATGIAYKRMGRPAEALKQYQESLDIRRRIGQKRGIAGSLTEIAQIHEGGNPREAVKSYNEALEIWREIGDKSGTSVTLINLANLLSESLGRSDEALPLLREALSIQRDLGNRGGEALALNSIGVVYLAKGQYSDAQTYFERALELRQQTKVPSEMADTLHNLGETLSKMGKYDDALSRYLRAVDLRRTDGDKRGEAIESYSMGTIFDYQGRYGAALKAKGEALQAFRDLKQRDFWFGEILTGYAGSLALSGRADEAATSLTEAGAVAKDLQNATLQAQVLRLQAERFYYIGDPSAAASTAAQAAQTASRAADRALQLWTEANVARMTAATQPTRAIVDTLARIGRDAEQAGHTYLAVYCSVLSAETLLRAGDRQQARREVERALARADTLGLRELLARSEYVLASALQAAGDPQARRHFASALKHLEEMKREAGEKLLERADLKAIHAECVKGSAAR
jgi:tetratricopeptide (TPR) repeat protein